MLLRDTNVVKAPAMKNYYPLLCIFTFLLCTHTALAAPFAGIFPDGEKPPLFTFLFVTFLGIITALAIHELGHLLTGLAQGFRFEMFVVFLLGIKRTGKGDVKVYINKNIGYMGGIAATVPTDPHADNRRKFARVIIAGPLASLVFALLCFAGLTFAKGALFSFFLIAGASSIGLFFATTLPKKSGMFFTDRARYQRLISKGKSACSEAALLEIMAIAVKDNSCKNLPLEKMRLLQEDDEDFMRFWGYYYEYYYFKENENDTYTATAKEKLLGMKSAVDKSVWKMLKIEG